VQADARARLSNAQAELVRSLAGHAPAPAGFDRARLAAASRALFEKRARSVQSSWPLMSNALGEMFLERFARYAEASPIPAEGGALADGRLFAQALEAAGEFPEQAGIEIIAFDARYHACPSGYTSRGGISIRAKLLKRPLRLIVICRHARHGERWINVPLSPSDYF
jgi:hypothetical protein